MVLESHGFPNTKDIFDEFLVSADLDGLRMPNPLFMQKILERFPGVAPHEVFLVGDQIDRDISSAHLAGMRTVFFSNVPSSRHANCMALAHGCPHPDFSILDFRQLRYVVEVLNKDMEYITQ